MVRVEEARMKRSIPWLLLVLAVCGLGGLVLTRTADDTAEAWDLPEPQFKIALADLHLPGGDGALAGPAAMEVERYTGVAPLVMPPVALPEAAYDSERRQYDADRALLALPSKEGYLVLGLTPVDTYTSGKPEWAYCFGIRRGNRALISQARTRGGTRFHKMVLRYVLEGAYGLPRNDDPRSLLFRTVLGPADLDRMEMRL